MTFFQKASPLRRLNFFCFMQTPRFKQPHPSFPMKTTPMDAEKEVPPPPEASGLRQLLQFNFTKRGNGFDR